MMMRFLTDILAPLAVIWLFIIPLAAAVTVWDWITGNA